nr:hypothetical protein [Actinomadura macra]
MPTPRYRYGAAAISLRCADTGSVRSRSQPSQWASGPRKSGGAISTSCRARSPSAVLRARFSGAAAADRKRNSWPGAGTSARWWAAGSIR